MENEKLLEKVVLHYKDGSSEEAEKCFICNIGEDCIEIKTTALKKSDFLNVAYAIKESLKNISEKDLRKA